MRESGFSLHTILLAWIILVETQERKVKMLKAWVHTFSAGVTELLLPASLTDWPACCELQLSDFQMVKFCTTMQPGRDGQLEVSLLSFTVPESSCHGFLSIELW